MRTRIFFVKSKETSYCPYCGTVLHHRDWKSRIRIKEGGEKSFIQIERMKCDHCDCLHTALPDILTPNKHYETEVISGVLDDVITADDLDSENYPCKKTIHRWQVLPASKPERIIDTNLSNILTVQKSKIVTSEQVSNSLQIKKQLP